MKVQQFKSMGLAVNLQVPSTVKEFDENAKKEGACLVEAINNVVYRGSLAEFRDLFLHGREADKEANPPVTAIKGLEDVTKIARKTKATGKKDDKGNAIEVFDETEGEYFDRVCSQLKVEATHFQKLADEVAAALKFDASARERKPTGPKKLAAKYKDTAAAIMAGPNLKRFLTDLEKMVGVKWTATGDKEKDTESLGWQVKAMIEYKEKQQLAALVG